MAVFFKCKSCGEEHSARMNLGNKANFENSSFSNMNFQCAKTGQMATYDKEDMFWKDES